MANSDYLQGVGYIYVVENSLGMFVHHTHANKKHK